MKTRGVVCAAVVAAFAAAAPPAESAFPGANGRIAYSYNSPNDLELSAVYTIEPDGTDKQALGAFDHTNPSAGISWHPDGSKLVFDNGCCVIESINADGSDQTVLDFNGLDPAWSPDGTKIAFASDRGSCPPAPCDFEIWLMNANGSGQAQLSENSAFDFAPAWSPDGTKIAFVSDRGPSGIWVMEAGGANAAFLAAGKNPSWSPDGSRLVFSRTSGASEEIFVMNAAGGDQTQLTRDSVNDTEPAWSPDGRKIVWVRQSGLYDTNLFTMNADGTSMAQLGSRSPNEDSQTTPDWQPIPVNAYPRPLGATPMNLSLVPSFKQCAAPNRAHGAPLSFGSCAPPSQTSSALTVGAPDANGAGAKSSGLVSLRTKLGNPATPADEADVLIAITVTDVRRSADLGDYAGVLQARPTLRITDRDNTPHPGGPGAGTVVDFPFPFSMPCSVTTDDAVGSTCAVNTTADAVAPGAVKERRRSIWALERFEVRDADGNAFLTQGLFIP